MESESVLEDFYRGISGQCLGSAVIAGLSLQRPGFDVGFVVDEVPLSQVSLLVCISVFPLSVSSHQYSYFIYLSPVLYVSDCLLH